PAPAPARPLLSCSDALPTLAVVGRGAMKIRHRQYDCRRVGHRAFFQQTWPSGRCTPKFAWLRVWPAHRWQHGRAADDVPDLESEARWLLVEWRTDGSIRYALSNLPAETPMLEAVGLWKTRWQVEQGYQQLKEELGLDHFEGRS